MTETELKQYYTMVTQAWELFMRHQNITAQNAQQWEALVSEADAIHKQNGLSPFAKRLVIAVMDELDRRARDSE